MAFNKELLNTGAGEVLARPFFMSDAEEVREWPSDLKEIREISSFYRLPPSLPARSSSLLSVSYSSLSRNPPWQ
jgi:hypothetical protein